MTTRLMPGSTMTLIGVVMMLSMGCGEPSGSGSGTTTGSDAGSSEETTSSNTPPPAEFPPSEPGVTTNFACSDAVSDCGYWYCRCEDGAIVNASFCVDGYCATDAAACAYACDYFGHGDWVSTAGGGPTSPGPTDGGTPPVSTDAGGDETPDTMCGVFRRDDDSCSECAVDYCCAEADRCGAESECASFQLCLNDCFGDGACEAACASTFPAGAADLDALFGCLGGFCELECGG